MCQCCAAPRHLKAGAMAGTRLTIRQSFSKGFSHSKYTLIQLYTYCLCLDYTVLYSVRMPLLWSYDIHFYVLRVDDHVSCSG